MSGRYHSSISKCLLIWRLRFNRHILEEFTEDMEKRLADDSKREPEVDKAIRDNLAYMKTQLRETTQAISDLEHGKPVTNWMRTVAKFVGKPRCCAIAIYWYYAHFPGTSPENAAHPARERSATQFSDEP